ncbi:MAG TPA: DNA polymerase I, partial [Nitrospiraceae bacterium]|nr:DNA polymerase I [Nitrospiraceae bacterium]
MLNRLKPVLENKAVAKIGQNMKYDMLVLAHHGIAVQGAAFDTMIASYVLHPGRPSHGLDALALEYLNYKTTTYADVTGTGRKQIGFDEVDVQTATDYSGEDADITLRLKLNLAPRLAEQGVEALFRDMEMPLMEVLADMERTGVRIDASFLQKMSGSLEGDISSLEEKIYELAGEKFNINSPK